MAAKAANDMLGQHTFGVCIPVSKKFSQLNLLYVLRFQIVCKKASETTNMVYRSLDHHR